MGLARSQITGRARIASAACSRRCRGHASRPRGRRGRHLLRGLRLRLLSKQEHNPYFWLLWVLFVVRIVDWRTHLPLDPLSFVRMQSQRGGAVARQQFLHPQASKCILENAIRPRLSAGVMRRKQSRDPCSLSRYPRSNRSTSEIRTLAAIHDAHPSTGHSSFSSFILSTKVEYLAKTGGSTSLCRGQCTSSRAASGVRSRRRAASPCGNSMFVSREKEG